MLYRLTLFASDQSKGLVSAMLGMITIALLGLGGVLMAMLGAGASLLHFAVIAGVAGALALWPLRRVIRDSRDAFERVGAKPSLP